MRAKTLIPALLVPAIHLSLVALAGWLAGWPAALASFVLAPFLMAATAYGLGRALLSSIEKREWPRFEHEFRANTSLTPEQMADAMRCFREARGLDKSTWVYDLTAPVVMWYVLLFVPRAANALPSLFKNWDNEVSINGDGWAIYRDGKWFTPRMVVPGEPGDVNARYDDPNYTGDAYYAPGYHPRSFVARYIWLGLRNRATAATARYGVEVTEKPTLVAGNIDHSTAKEGFSLLADATGRYWHYTSHTRRGRKVVRRNVGFKLGIPYQTESGTGLAIPVNIPWSVKGWKGHP